MRLTQALRSDMYFGKLAKIRGIVECRVSPHELNPFAGFFSEGIPNTIRRFRGQVFRVAPPFILSYILYDWAENENARLSRKNPADFANDK